MAIGLFFDVVHAGQEQDLGSMLGVVAVIGTGGLLFGWLFVRWNFSLWPPILLHIGLNGLWLIFGPGNDAIGGLVGNGLRLGIVLVAIVVTIRLAPMSNEPPESLSRNNQLGTQREPAART